MNYFPKSLLRHTIFGFITLTLFSNVAGGSTQVLTLTENKRLEANIASEFMNRLAVTQDRIINIFGDEGTFVTQTDEHTGQIFIKPTPENVNSPLPITLITENGITQDLTLNPIASTATTIVLKSSETNHRSSPPEVLLPGFSRSTENNEQEFWITAMRQAVLGELPELQEKQALKRTVSGFEVKHQKTYQAGPLKVKLFTLKNNSKVTRELFEKNFFQPGDIALSLKNTLLQPGEKTSLYVLGVS